MLPFVLPWGGLVLLGVAVGTFGTLIGAGGGFLLVPILLLLYPNDSVETITAISLAVVFMNATSGSLAYARLGRIDYRTGVVFALASAPGAVIGALLTGLLPRGAFDVLFGVVLVMLAAYLLLRGKVIEGHEMPEHVNLPVGAALSFLVGVFSSVLGIGGGVIHVPLLIQFLGFPAHIATATSHFILAIMSGVGTLTHIMSGEFDTGVRRTIAIGAGVLIGAQIGAKLSQRVHGRLILRALSVGLLGVGARLIVKAVPLAIVALAAVHFASTDQQVLATHALAYPHNTLVGFIASALGLALGVLVLVLVLSRRRDGGHHAAGPRPPIGSG
ncbi:MAG: sulfite exporter TauE/SafE family protein [Chloroflexi bacterium]|nr:sulfite exporter TauE/SafE family protein [Chloroflexota bacterium]